MAPFNKHPRQIQVGYEPPENIKIMLAAHKVIKYGPRLIFKLDVPAFIVCLRIVAFVGEDISQTGEQTKLADKDAHGLVKGEIVRPGPQGKLFRAVGKLLLLPRGKLNPEARKPIQTVLVAVPKLDPHGNVT